MFFFGINDIIRNNQTKKVVNMSVLDDIKGKLETNESLDKEIGKAFGNIYSCTRVWSAWGHDTMSADDFAPFEKGDEAFDEFVKELKEIGLIKGDIEGASVCYCIDEKVWNNAKKQLNQLFFGYMSRAMFIKVLILQVLSVRYKT